MHIPVLLQEVLDGLSLTKGDTVVDATVGGGGYTVAFCEAVGKGGRVVGFDADADALVRASAKCASTLCTFIPITSNFRLMAEKLPPLGITEVDGCAFDLGLSSFQLEESGRGFSFLKDEPLHMTFTKDPGGMHFTAGDIVNGWEEEAIANVIFGYGEERFARRIAKGIVERRSKGPIETTGQLVDVIRHSVPSGYTFGPLHFATKTFQALRIAVNDELHALEEGLAGAYALLKPGKRLAVVSFHSMEDRIVKNFIRAQGEEGAQIITKKPITPGRDEVRRNPRSRSAKLRIVEKNY